MKKNRSETLIRLGDEYKKAKEDTSRGIEEFDNHTKNCSSCKNDAKHSWYVCKTGKVLLAICAAYSERENDAWKKKEAQEEKETLIREQLRFILAEMKDMGVIDGS